MEKYPEALMKTHQYIVVSLVDHKIVSSWSTLRDAIEERDREAARLPYDRFEIYSKVGDH